MGHGDRAVAREAGVDADTVSWGGALRSRWALVSLSTLLYWCASHALRPFVALRLDDLGVGDAFIGLAVGAFPVLSLFLAIPVGRAVDRVGIRWVLGASCLGMAAAGTGLALATAPAQLLALQMVDGVAELGAWLALQALASSSGRGAMLVRQLALFSLAWGIGTAIGPIVGAAIYERLGFAFVGWTYVALAGVALAAGWSAPTVAVERAERTAGSPSLLAGTRLIAARPAVKAVLVASFVALFANAIRSSFYPLYLERAGFSVSRIGLLLSIIGIAMLGIRVVLPALLSRFTAGSILLAGMWVEVVAITITPALGAFWLLVIAAAAFGAGHGLNPPITVEMMAANTSRTERGLAMGVRVTANRLAQVVQPALFGAVAGVFGIAAAFPAAGAALAGVILYAGRQMRGATIAAPESTSADA